jgi:hypothetical protein
MPVALASLVFDFFGNLDTDYLDDGVECRCVVVVAVAAHVLPTRYILCIPYTLAKKRKQA